MRQKFQFNCRLPTGKENSYDNCTKSWALHVDQQKLYTCQEIDDGASHNASCCYSCGAMVYHKQASAEPRQV